MESQLHFALVQADCEWENPSANCKRIESLLQVLDKAVDIVVLPEMFASGFSMNPEKFASTMDGPTVQWMQEWAVRNHKVLAGSLAIVEKGQYYNRFLWATPEGTVFQYDKRYGFSLAGEDKKYKAGTTTSVFEYRGWRICPRICYDLRFPMWSRNTQEYDLLLFVANWPKPRIHAWDILLQARAIENLSYCIGVNRVGEDPNGNKYPGHTTAYDALGHQLSESLDEKEGIVTIVLDRDPMMSLRKQLNFLADRDEFEWDQKLD